MASFVCLVCCLLKNIFPFSLSIDFSIIYQMPDTVKIQYQTSLKFVSRFLMKSCGKSGRIYHRRLLSPVISKEILGVAPTGCICALMFVFSPLEESERMY